MADEQYTLSLLSPKGKYDYHELTDQTINDLSIPFIAEQVGKTKDERLIIYDVLKRMPVDPEVIRYRRDVYVDLKNQKGLGEQLLNIVKEMRFYTVVVLKRWIKMPPFGISFPV